LITSIPFIQDLPAPAEACPPRNGGKLTDPVALTEGQSMSGSGVGLIALGSAADQGEPGAEEDES
jgi:hypothetical protein